MKRTHVIHVVTKGLFTITTAFAATMELTNNPLIMQTIDKLGGYPHYFVSLLGGSKLLGLLALWMNRFSRLTEWAYAGFTFNIVFAIASHVMAKDGQAFNPLISLALLAGTYFTRQSLWPAKPASTLKQA